MNQTINMTITPAWSVIQAVRKKIETQLGGALPRRNVDAALITASELCENAIKYGESVSSMRFIQFQLTYEPGEISIEISNGVVNQIDIDNVCSTIEKINHSPNPEELYLERLQELMNLSGPQVSRLGLFRIVCETGFSLKYAFENQVLTINSKLKIV